MTQQQVKTQIKRNNAIMPSLSNVIKSMYVTRNEKIRKDLNFTSIRKMEGEEDKNNASVLSYDHSQKNILPLKSLRSFF